MSMMSVVTNMMALMIIEAVLIPPHPLDLPGLQRGQDDRPRAGLSHVVTDIIIHMGPSWQAPHDDKLYARGDISAVFHCTAPRPVLGYVHQPESG